MENNNKGGNFRSTIPPFTMVDNRVIENKNLSMKAKGLYLIIMHYVTIPNFTLNKRYLMSLSKEGERAFDSTWKELKDAGYLKQYRLKGEGGKWVYEYELLIEPIIENDIKEMQNKKPSTSAKVESYNNNIKKIIFSSTVTEIENRAFTECISLEEVVLPKNLESIREHAFSGCTALSRVYFADSDIAAEDGKFIFPNTLTSLELCAFERCNSLKSVIIPESITVIASGFL